MPSRSPSAAPLEQEVAHLLKRRQPPSLEWAIAKTNASGARVNNLFQTASGQWQANLRQREPHVFFEFATGATPVEALLKALGKFAARATVIGSTAGAEVVSPPMTGDEIEGEDLFGDPDDLDDLLG